MQQVAQELPVEARLVEVQRIVLPAKHYGAQHGLLSGRGARMGEVAREGQEVGHGDQQLTAGHKHAPPLSQCGHHLALAAGQVLAAVGETGTARRGQVVGEVLQGVRAVEQATMLRLCA